MKEHEKCAYCKMLVKKSEASIYKKLFTTLYFHTYCIRLWVHANKTQAQGQR